ncbi:NINE protein [Parapusillimonas sp. JC17]|uniref:NINE protein n=1 Tax=Parapusillimonas sp. JC17 TaxID=3445768 RepID=UPI003F9F48DD
MTEFTTPVPHRSKVAAAWLACLLGMFGAHWWYMGRRWAWAVTAFSLLMIVLAQLYPVWWDNPPFLLLLIPTTAGYIDALVYALMPDEKFDARYNSGSRRMTKTGWNAVIAAIFTTFFGSTVVMFGIAVTVMHVYTAMGWLDGLVY